MKKNFIFFIIIFVIAAVVNVLPSIISSYLNENRAQLLGFAVVLLGWFLEITVSLGMIGIALRLHDKKKTEYKNLFDHFKLVIPYFFASILYGLMVLVGLILLIVPGIIWGIKYRYFTYFMVDRGMGPIDALKASSKITKGNMWNLFLLGLMLIVVNLLGVLALGVGLLLTIPTTMMAEAYVYRKLSAK